MIEKIGGRKFLVGVATLAIGVALEILTPKGLTPVMATFLIGAGTTYFLANVGNKRVSPMLGIMGTGEEPEKEPAETTAEPAPQPEPEPQDPNKALVEAILRELKPQVQAMINQNVVIAQTVGEVAKGTTFLVNYVQNSAAAR